MKHKIGAVMAGIITVLALTLSWQGVVRAECNPHMCDPITVDTDCNPDEKCVAYCCIQPTPGPSSPPGSGGGRGNMPHFNDCAASHSNNSWLLL